MIDLDTFGEQARAWTASMIPEFGREARRGRTDEQDLALGRRYMTAKYDAGFAGMTRRWRDGEEATQALACECEAARRNQRRVVRKRNHDERNWSVVRIVHVDLDHSLFAGLNRDIRQRRNHGRIVARKHGERETHLGRRFAVAYPDRDHGLAELIGRGLNTHPAIAVEWARA